VHHLEKIEIKKVVTKRRKKNMLSHWEEKVNDNSKTKKKYACTNCHKKKGNTNTLIHICIYI